MKTLHPEIKHFLDNATEAEIKTFWDTLENNRLKGIEKALRELRNLAATSKQPCKYIILPEN